MSNFAFVPFFSSLIAYFWHCKSKFNRFRPISKTKFV